MSSKEWKMTRNGSIKAHLLFYCFISSKKSKKGSKCVNCEKWEPQLSVEEAGVFALGGTIMSEYKLYSSYNFWELLIEK